MAKTKAIELQIGNGVYQVEANRDALHLFSGAIEDLQQAIASDGMLSALSGAAYLLLRPLVGEHLIREHTEALSLPELTWILGEIVTLNNLQSKINSKRLAAQILGGYTN